MSYFARLNGDDTGGLGRRRPADSDYAPRKALSKSRGDHAGTKNRRNLYPGQEQSCLYCLYQHKTGEQNGKSCAVTDKNIGLSHFAYHFCHVPLSAPFIAPYRYAVSFSKQGRPEKRGGLNISAVREYESQPRQHKKSPKSKIKAEQAFKNTPYCVATKRKGR